MPCPGQRHVDRGSSARWALGRCVRSVQGLQGESPDSGGRGEEEPQFPFSAGLAVIFKHRRFDVMLISISGSLKSIFLFMWGY